MRVSLRLNVVMKSSDGSDLHDLHDLASIGALAERFGLAPHVLRHWESVGLLSPHRDGAGRRRYGPEDAFRVAAILGAKEAGLGLDRIRAMLAATDRPTRRALLQPHRDLLRRRIAEAQAALAMVESALDCPHDEITACPAFRATVTRRAREGGLTA
jgi:MerR family transcriptional regulator, copper efflux regulator